MDRNIIRSCAEMDRIVKELKAALASRQEYELWGAKCCDMLSISVDMNNKWMLDHSMDLAAKCYRVRNDFKERDLFIVRREYCRIYQERLHQEVSNGWEYFASLYKRYAENQKKSLVLIYRVRNLVQNYFNDNYSMDAAVTNLSSIWEDFLNIVPDFLLTWENFGEASELLRSAGRWNDYLKYGKFIMDNITKVSQQVIDYSLPMVLTVWAEMKDPLEAMYLTAKYKEELESIVWRDTKGDNVSWVLSLLQSLERKALSGEAGEEGKRLWNMAKMKKG